MTEPKPIKFTEPPANTLQDCDAVLGAYMRAWDQIELQLLPMFTGLLGAHQNAALVLLNAGLDQPKLRTILDALASFRLDDGERRRLKALLERRETASSKRNRIVHGNWMLSIEMVEGPSGKRDHTKSEWIRFHHPANPADMHRMMGEKDQKLTAKHRFRLKDIEQAAADVRKLAADMEAFNQSMVVLAFVTPRPIPIDQ